MTQEPSQQKQWANPRTPERGREMLTRSGLIGHHRSDYIAGIPSWIPYPTNYDIKLDQIAMY